MEQKNTKTNQIKDDSSAALVAEDVMKSKGQKPEEAAETEVKAEVKPAVARNVQIEFLQDSTFWTAGHDGVPFCNYYKKNHGAVVSESLLETLTEQKIRYELVR